MAIPVTCTSCGLSGHAPDSANGKRVKCRKCGASILVAHLEPSPPAAPAPPPSPEILVAEEKVEAPPPPAAPKPEPAAAPPAPDVELLPTEPWYYRAAQIAAGLYALAAPVIAVQFAIFVILAYPDKPAMIFAGIAVGLLFGLISVALAGAVVVFLDIGRDIRQIRRRVDTSDEAGEAFTE